MPECSDVKNKIYKCVGNTTVDHLCRSYSAPLDEFDNYHCMQCMNKRGKVDPTTFMKQIMYCDLYDHTPGVLPDLSTRPKYFRWSFLLTFSGESSQIEDVKSGGKLNCKKNEIFNIRTKSCTKFTCPTNYKSVGLKCVAEADEGVKKIFSLPVLTDDLKIARMNSTRKIDGSSVVNARDLYLLIKNIFIASFDYRLYTTEIETLSIIPSTNFRTTPFNITFSKNGNNTKLYKSDQRLTLEQFKLLETLSNVTFTIAPNIDFLNTPIDKEVNFSRYFTDFRICAITVKIPLHFFDVKTKSAKYHGQHFNFNDLTFFTNSNTSDQKLYGCLGFHLLKPCRRETIHESDVLKIYKNLSLVTKTSIFSFNEYIPVQNGYETCIISSNLSVTKNFKESTESEFSIVYQMEHYITYIGTSISIICYCWVISTYVLFKDLRTVPGLNVCFMCASLLIADLFFLVSIIARQNETACTTFAVVIHWSLLAAFIWVLIICFDLVQRFGSVSMHSRDREIKRMYYRAVIAFLTPAILVATLVGLDLTKMVVIGYGTHHICWITNRSAKLFAYVVPTAFILLIAFLALVYTLFKIVSEKRDVNRTIHHKASKTKSTLLYLRMAIKLAAILGLVEIFGYIQTSYQGDKEKAWVVIFGFLYTLFRSFRGLVLWFVYIYGGAIAKRYRKLFTKSIVRKFSKQRHDDKHLASSTATSSSYVTSTTKSSTTNVEDFCETKT